MIDVEMLRPTADEMLSGISATDAMKQRVLFRANVVERLPAVTSEMLGGLSSTPALRHRILVRAERLSNAKQPVSVETPARAKRPVLSRLTPAIGMMAVLALMIGLGVNYGRQNVLAPVDPLTAQTDLGSFMAGGDGTYSGTVPEFRSLYVGEGANPPVIGVNGRFYQMLSIPVSDTALGDPIAEIQSFTDEPSLASTVGVVSNVAQAGAQVYSVSGISSKTACIAEVDGKLRLFQRIGYASESIVGGEQFEDTLDVNGKVTALELSSVGIITDENDANELIYMLSEFASYQGSDLSGSSQALTIYLRNGLSLQLMVQDDILSGCGSWSCPEFFESFEAFLNK